MKKILSIASLFFWIISLSPLHAQKAPNWELDLSRIENDYARGDYKKALVRSDLLVKKLNKKEGTSQTIKARAYAQLAKIYEGSGKFNEYQTNLGLSLGALQLSDIENNAYGLALVAISDAYLQFGDYTNAQQTIEKALKLSQEKKLTDSVLINTVQGKLSEVYYHQGYLVKAQQLLPSVIKFRQARVVKRENYLDQDGKVKKRKLKKPERKLRARSAADAMNLLSLITLENGDLVGADTLIPDNSGYIKRNLGKKDVAMVENTFQSGLHQELIQKKYAACERIERAAKRSTNSKGIRLKPMGKPAMRIQEKRIISLKKASKDSHARKRKKIYETRVSRTYKKNSIYYGHIEMIETEMEMVTEDYKDAEEQIMGVLNNPVYAPKNRPERIRALKLLYEICLLTDQYLKAEGCLEQIIDARKVMHGDLAPVTLMAHLDLADFHVLYSSKFKEAEEIYTSDLPRIDKEIDHRHKNFLNYLYNYASLLEYTDRFEKALQVLAEAETDTRKLYSENHPKYATALERIANVYIDLGRYPEAEKNLITANEIFKKPSYAIDYGDYSHELQTFARLYIIQGEYQEAKKVLRRSFQKQGMAGGDSKLTEGIDELATLNIETGKYQETERNLLETLELKENKYGPTHRSLVNPLNQLGHLNLITGNYVEADNYAKRAATISAKIFGESSIKFAESLKLLGNIYNSIGDYEKAEEVMQKALDILKQQYGTNHIQIAMTLNDLALVKFYNNEKPQKVESLLLEALEMTKVSLSDKHPRYASILSNLALFYVETGNLEKSQSLLDQANAIWITKFGEYNVHSAEIFLIKGNVSYKKKNFVQAKADYTNSKSIYQRVFENDNHPGYLSAVSKIGQMSFILGDYKAAVKALDETTTSYLTFIQNYFPSLSEREKTKFWNNIQKDFEFYNTLVYKLKDEDPTLISKSYNFALSTKALLLNSSIKVRQRIMDSKDPELIKKFEEWTSKREFLTSSISLTSEQRKESGIDVKVLEGEIEALEKELSEKSESFASNFQKKVYDWRDIRKNLLPDEVAIEFIRFRTFYQSFTDTVMYAALIITPESKSYPSIVILKNGSELEHKWLKYYRNCMKFNVEDKQSYENFWKPLSGLIKENATVYLSPEGVYNQINVETIRNPNGKFVLDQNRIVLVSNTRDLISRRIEEGKSSKSKNKNTAPKLDNSQITLFGNPMYYSDSELKSTEKDILDSLLQNEKPKEIKRITQLPGAEQEVKDLHALLTKNGMTSSAFLQDSATEGVIKDLKNVKIFHIATHGFFMEDVESDLEGINQNRAVENPLLRSGLLLKDGGYLLEKDNAYEFNSSEGVLTAYEAMNLNFDHAELVVLSACETGLGKVQLGEGVYGLQRSFLVAGAKTVVMSLFKVSDKVTQELMTLFYQNWITTGDKRQSFIDAKKAIKEKYQNPILWGAFIMVGME